MGASASTGAFELVLKRRSVEAEAMFKQAAIHHSEASLMQEAILADDAEVAKQAEVLNAIYADVQKDIDVATPALEDATVALDDLGLVDICGLKVLASDAAQGRREPPLGVTLTMEAVCIMLGAEPDWGTFKKLLEDSGRFHIFHRLKEYDKDNIDMAVLEKLQKYTADEAFNLDAVGLQSTDTATAKGIKGLCVWCHAMDVYSRVAKEVKPRVAKLRQLGGELDAANEKLAGKKNELQAVLDRLAELRLEISRTLLQDESTERCAIFEPILKAAVETYAERRAAGEAHDEAAAGMLTSAADEPEAGLYPPATSNSTSTNTSTTSGTTTAAVPSSPPTAPFLLLRDLPYFSQGEVSAWLPPEQRISLALSCKGMWAVVWQHQVSEAEELRAEAMAKVASSEEQLGGLEAASAILSEADNECHALLAEVQYPSREFSELKGFARPPKRVVDVARVVCCLIAAIPSTSIGAAWDYIWKKFKAFLTRYGFPRNVVCFLTDFRNVVEKWPSAPQLVAAKTLLVKLDEDGGVEASRRISQGAAVFHEWAWIVVRQAEKLGEAAGRALQSKAQAEKAASRHEGRLRQLYPVPLAPEEVKERLGVSLYDEQGKSRPVQWS